MKPGSVLGPCLPSLGHSRVHRAYIKLQRVSRWHVTCRRRRLLINYSGGGRGHVGLKRPSTRLTVLVTLAIVGN